MEENILLLKGTNERDLIKVISSKDSEALEEMLHFGYNCNLYYNQFNISNKSSV